MESDSTLADFTRMLTIARFHNVSFSDILILIWPRLSALPAPRSSSLDALPFDAQRVAIYQFGKVLGELTPANLDKLESQIHAMLPCICSEELKRPRMVTNVQSGPDVA